MTMPPVPGGLVVPDVSEETHNRNLLRVVQEEADRLQRLPEIFPGLQISPGIKLKPRQRLGRFLTLIQQAYTFPHPDGSVVYDEPGAMFELDNLLDPEYMDRMKAGAAPAPRSRPWSTLLPVRFAWRELQKTFISDYKAWERTVGDD